MKLRVGITCFPTFGGSGIVATEIGLSLAARGHDVHFISSDVPVRLGPFSANVSFHAVEARDYPLLDPSPYTLALASKMIAVATYHSLDLFHVHYAVPHATSAYLARQVLGGGPKLVTTLHGTDVTLVGSDPGFLPVTRFSVLASDGITVPSEALRESTYVDLQVPRTVPIEVIPNFVDTSVFRPAPRRDDRLRALFPALEPDAAILVHNSNFRPVKRVDDTVRVLAELRRARPAALVLIGDGPERGRVESLARELGVANAVRFLGKQRSFVEVLQHSDLFLMPSAAESFGLAALEALACGVPVLGTRVGGVPALLLDGKLGALCEVGDVAGMARAADELLGDRARWLDVSRLAVAEVAVRWQREPIVDRYEAYYRRVLG